MKGKGTDTDVECESADERNWTLSRSLNRISGVSIASSNVVSISHEQHQLGEVFTA